MSTAGWPPTPPAPRAATRAAAVRSRSPAVIEVADRSAALREEARIKRLTRAAKLELTGG